MIFKFKQFAVDQAGCAMKINTDGVLLGALLSAGRPEQILDIGTGTGVIALMLAQRFETARIDTVEIDESAASTASKNFHNSVFNDRLQGHHNGFEEFLSKYPEKRYDLIVSNPPFYINALKPASTEMSKAKHADRLFFDRLIECSSSHLNDEGLLWLVLPVDTSLLVEGIAQMNDLFINNIIEIRSYPDSVPHRRIVAIGKKSVEIKKTDFVIYDAPKAYSAQYRELLKPFLTIF